MPIPAAMTNAKDKARSPALEQVVRANLGAQAHGKLRKALSTGELRPGERLNGRALAARLGTSLTPVREALLQLVAEGALEMQAGKAFTVPVPTRAAYLELRDLRLVLEGMAAERAAVAISPLALTRLATAHRKLCAAKERGDFAGALRWNEEFHLGLAAAAGMPRLLRLVEGLWIQSGPFLNDLRADWPHTVAEPHPHLLVLQALDARNGQAAAAAIRRDILEGGEGPLRRLEG